MKKKKNGYPVGKSACCTNIVTCIYIPDRYIFKSYMWLHGVCHPILYINTNYSQYFSVSLTCFSRCLEILLPLKVFYLSRVMVPRACDPSTQEKEAGESRVQGQSELQSKILSHKNKFCLYMILFRNLRNIILAMFIYSISVCLCVTSCIPISSHNNISHFIYPLSLGVK